MVEIFSSLFGFLFLAFVLYLFFRIFKPYVDAENKRNKLVIQYLQILIDKENKS